MKREEKWIKRDEVVKLKKKHLKKSKEKYEK